MKTQKKINKYYTTILVSSPHKLRKYEETWIHT